MKFIILLVLFVTILGIYHNYKKKKNNLNINFLTGVGTNAYILLNAKQIHERRSIAEIRWNIVKRYCCVLRKKMIVDDIEPKCINFLCDKKI